MKEEKMDSEKISGRQIGSKIWEAFGLTNYTDRHRDAVLALLLWRKLSVDFEEACQRELGDELLVQENFDVTVRRGVLSFSDGVSPLERWYEQNPSDVPTFESHMQRKLGYIISPKSLWSKLDRLTHVQDPSVFQTLSAGFKSFDDGTFDDAYNRLFSGIDLSVFLPARVKLPLSIRRISDLFATIGDGEDLFEAYDYVVERMMKIGPQLKAFHTPPEVSEVLARIATFESVDPSSGPRNDAKNVLDFTSGSGALLMRVRQSLGPDAVGKIYAQDVDKISRMTLLLYGLKNNEFEFFCGDTLTNEWNVFKDVRPGKKPIFDVVVAAPPVTIRHDVDALLGDPRFAGYGKVSRGCADTAFLLHGLHYLSEQGTMAILLHSGITFRGGEEAVTRQKLVEDNQIDAVINLPDRKSVV